MAAPGEPDPSTRARADPLSRDSGPESCRPNVVEYSGDMKRWRCWAILLACVTTALLLAPAGASAKSGYVVLSRGEHTVELNLKGSHGYAINILVRNGYFKLSAYKKEIVVVYSPRHYHLRGDGIEAKLPGVGRVSVQFHPQEPKRREPSFFFPQKCYGGLTVKQAGYYLGTIRLHGERGYTAVNATSAPGKVETTAKEFCKRSIFEHPKPKPEEQKIRLFAYSKSADRVVAFDASTLRNSLSATTSFSGYTSELRSGMGILRWAVLLGPESDFLTSDASDLPTTATVTPPSPFLGSAAFQRLPGGNNAWTGLLSINLPGAGDVALAGPEFSASLCRDTGCPRPRGSFRGSFFSGR
jgi:hypothetical protein